MTSFVACDSSCESCIASGPSGCVKCRSGFKMEDGTCQGIFFYTLFACCSLVACNVLFNARFGHETCRGVHSTVFYHLPDINECEGENRCNKKSEKCENTVGSYECGCKSGYQRKDDKCTKLKGNKNAKRSKKSKDKLSQVDDPLTKLLKENKHLSETHLKVGTFLYACFFVALYFLYRRQGWLGICALLIVFAACIFVLNRSYPNVDPIPAKGA